MISWFMMPITPTRRSHDAGQHEFPEYPIALGVIRNVKDSTYDDNVRDQVLEVMKGI